MFTLDAVQQIVADHRSHLMAEAENARTINAAVVSTDSKRAARMGRRHLRSAGAVTNLVTALHRS
jgi:hypothetical protein